MIVRLASLYLFATALFAVGGCSARRSQPEWRPTEAEYAMVSQELESPRVTEELEDGGPPAAPWTLHDNHPPEFLDLTLEQAIRQALSRSSVIRDLGGRVLQSPDNLVTAFTPAIRQTDPIFGEEAALSAFDAQLAASAFFENNDRAVNNTFFGGGTRTLKQDLHNYQLELSKRTGVGGEFALRKNFDYDYNNSPGNDNPDRPWDVQLEAEFRQPLFRGAGVEYARLVGPNGTPGQLRGVVLARLNTDVAIADFEIAIRDFVSDVENAYWELHYAYRDLDAKIAARDRALQVYNYVKTLAKSGRQGGETPRLAEAGEQYERLKAEVQNALSGQLQEAARTTTFRGAGGVQVAERRLRRLMGMPIADRGATQEKRLIRPVDEPLEAEVLLDWSEVWQEAMHRRPELRRQRWRQKLREMELAASQHFLRPQVDVVGRYRWRGLGSDLITQGESFDPLDDAVGNLVNGDHQEWQLGVEFSTTLGFRQAHAAVTQAEHSLSREKATLRDMRHQVELDLQNAFAEVQRAYSLADTHYNQLLHAKIQVDYYSSPNVLNRTPPREMGRLLDKLLEAQRRLSEAESRYYQERIKYTLAVKQVHLQKGSLLEYNQVYLTEGGWPQKAYHDAQDREAHRYDSRFNEKHDKHGKHGQHNIVSEGVYPQEFGGVYYEDGSPLSPGEFPASPSDIPGPAPPIPTPPPAINSDDQPPIPGETSPSDRNQSVYDAPPSGMTFDPSAPVPPSPGVPRRPGNVAQPPAPHIVKKPETQFSLPVLRPSDPAERFQPRVEQTSQPVKMSIADEPPALYR